MAKTPEEQASLDAIFAERHKLNESMISRIRMIVEMPFGQGANNDTDKVKWISASIHELRGKLEKLFTAHERKFP